MTTPRPDEIEAHPGRSSRRTTTTSRCADRGGAGANCSARRRRCRYQSRRQRVRARRSAPPKAGAPEEMSARRCRSTRRTSAYLSDKGEALARERSSTSRTLSVQEGFVVYFKVSMLCGIVLGEPVHPLPVLGVRRRRAVPAREEVRLPDVRPEPRPVPRRRAAVPVRRAAGRGEGAARVQRVARLRPGHPAERVARASRSSCRSCSASRSRRRW